MIHRIWVKNGDQVCLVTNPEPSCADPASTVGTVISSFNVVDEGYRGTSLVQSRHEVFRLNRAARNETEFSRLKDESVKGYYP